MQKYLIGLLFAVFINLSAAEAAVYVDSIGVENLNGKKLILHKVVQNDTYYSISRRYQIPPKEIMLFNDNKYLQLGVVIKVPTNLPFTATQSGSVATQHPSTQSTNYIEHIVQKRENLNMLAGKYYTTVDEIKRINELRSINLSIGQVLKMPADVAATPVTETVNPQPLPITKPVNPQVPKTQTKATQQLPAPTANADTAYEDLLVHTVASNETMYSIATTYKMSMDQLKAKNNLSTNILRVGQKLLIRGKYGAKRRNEEIDLDTDTLTSIKSPSLRYAPSKYGLNQIDEKGTGISISDPDLDATKMLVLHRTAPIGTVIKVTNPMSNRSTFAKVVGKFTENESTKDVIIVMTKAVADALGVLDKRFFCNLTYSGQDTNEQ